MLRVVLVTLLSLNVLFACWQFLLRPLLLSDSEQDSRTVAQQKSNTDVQEGGDVAEASDAGADNIAPTVGEIEEDAPARATPTVCYHLGPLQGDAIEKAEKRLFELEVVTEKILEKTPLAPDYWVYLTPQTTRRAAMQLLRELHARRIDSYIVGEGELKDAISLGFFSNERYALDTQAQRIADGYDARLKTVARFEETVIFQIGEVAHAEVGGSFWKELLKGQSRAKLLAGECQLIAPQPPLE